MAKLLFIDTETGGLDPQKHSLLSVAFGVWSDGIIIDTLDISIRHENYVVTEQAMSINQIDLRNREYCVASEDATGLIINFVVNHFGHEKAVVVGQNVQFDIGFLKVLFGLEEYEELFSHRVIDTASLLRFLQLSGTVEPFGSSLSDAMKYFHIHLDDHERHTALGDVCATIEVFNRLITLVKGVEADGPEQTETSQP